MTTRVKALIWIVLTLSVWSIRWAAGYPHQSWLRFAVYLAMVLLSSGLKVPMPKGDGTASVNFPLLLLGVVQLSPGQTIIMAVMSVLAQCSFKVLKPFTVVQIAFNAATTANATALAWFAYASLIHLHWEAAPALAFASITYFLANTAAVSMVIGWSKGENPILVWRREFPWYLPFYLVGAILAYAADFVSQKVGWATSLLLCPLIYTIYRTYQAQQASIRAREKHLKDTEELHLRTIEGLAMAVEAKDHNTHDHLVRVRVYVSEIGEAMGLDKLQLQALVTASFLHDIGKLAIPEHIINKPGKLSKEEFDIIKTHTVIGADILERVRFPYPVVPIVRSHHEAWDGSGYPDGLSGEQIPIGARILTAVDCFDALASDRPYRRALPVDEAMNILREKSGIQFDPKVVEILERLYVDLEEKARTQCGNIAPLISDVTISRGETPGAGFEESRSSQPAALQGTASKAGASPANEMVLAQERIDVSAELSSLRESELAAHELIPLLSSRLKGVIPFEYCALYVREEDVLKLQYLDGPDATRFSAASIPMGEGVSGWALQSNRPIVNGNPTVEANYNPRCHSSPALRCALSFPISDISGESFSVLTLYSSSEAAFSKDDIRLLQTIEGRIALAVREILANRTVGSAAKSTVQTLPPRDQRLPQGELVSAAESKPHSMPALEVATTS